MLRGRIRAHDLGVFENAETRARFRLGNVGIGAHFWDKLSLPFQTYRARFLETSSTNVGGSACKVCLLYCGWSHKDRQSRFHPFL